MVRKWIPAAIWASVIFATSCTVIGSKAFVKTVSTAIPTDHSAQYFDSFWHHWWWLFVKGYHVMEYTLLTVLLGYWLGWKRLWIAFALAVTYAATDEFHQSFVPNRGGRWTDVCIDSGGALLGLLMAMLITRRLNRIPQCD